MRARVVGAERQYNCRSPLHLANCYGVGRQFTIRGKYYGVSSECSPLFGDDAEDVQLSDFRFRRYERFLYEYDFGDLWQHEIRVEERLAALDPGSKENLSDLHRRVNEMVRRKTVAAPGDSWRSEITTTSTLET